MKRASLAAAVVFAAIVSPAAAAEPIRLGFIATMSGILGLPGEEMKRGLDLALEDLGGKLGGVPVTVYAVDDKGIPAEGVQAASKLIDQYDIQIVTGLMASNVVVAVEKSFLDANVFVVGALSGLQQFAGKECHQDAFFTSFENDDWDRVLGSYMNEKGVKSAYFMAADYQAGWEKIEGAMASFKGKAIGPVYTPLTQLDFSAEIAQLRAAKPDAVFLFYPGGLGIAFLKQYAQAGLQGQIPIYSEDTIASELSFPAEGDTALGIVQSTSWAAELDNPANQKFVGEFEKKYGRRPAIFAALQYDAVRLLDSAVAAVHGDITKRDAFGAALRKAEFQSIRGPFKFDNNQFPIQNIYITVVEKDAAGKLKIALKGIAATDWRDAYHDQCPLK